jgi:hypothetical protein
MRPRWSRLALAAILAFGVCPTVDVAVAADDDRGPDAGCPCRHDDTAAPSLVVDGEHPLCRSAARASTGSATPLCEAIATTVAARSDVALDVTAEPLATGEPGPRWSPWRLAPKTSPPRR